MPPTENSAALFGWHSQDSRATGPLDTADTVTAHYGTGGGNTPLIVQPCICIQRLHDRPRREKRPAR